MTRLYELFVLLRHAWRLWRAGSEAFDDELIEAYGRAWERVDDAVMVVKVAPPESASAAPGCNRVHFSDPRRRIH